MKLDPLSLRLFVRVVEEGTIAAAAELEHIAAPAVSKRLRELEELFRTPLLVRTNKGITPTAAGVNLSVLSRDVLDDLRNIVLQMKAFSDGLRGSVRVLVNISAISTCMPPLVKPFSERYPDVDVSLLERDSLAITESVYRFISARSDAWIKKNEIKLKENYGRLLKDDEYLDAVRYATGDKNRVRTRFRVAREQLGAGCVD